MACTVLFVCIGASQRHSVLRLTAHRRRDEKGEEELCWSKRDPDNEFAGAGKEERNGEQRQDNCFEKRKPLGLWLLQRSRRLIFPRASLVAQTASLFLPLFLHKRIDRTAGRVGKH